MDVGDYLELGKYFAFFFISLFFFLLYLGVSIFPTNTCYVIGSFDTTYWANNNFNVDVLKKKYKNKANHTQRFDQPCLP